jgi:hypothetical protein
MARPAPHVVPPEARQAPGRAVPMPGQIDGPWAVLTGRGPDGNTCKKEDEGASERRSRSRADRCFSRVQTPAASVQENSMDS